jgi:hypothetical protein
MKKREREEKIREKRIIRENSKRGIEPKSGHPRAPTHCCPVVFKIMKATDYVIRDVIASE